MDCFDSTKSCIPGIVSIFRVYPKYSSPTAPVAPADSKDLYQDPHGTEKVQKRRKWLGYHARKNG